MNGKTKAMLKRKRGESSFRQRMKRLNIVLRFTADDGIKAFQKAAEKIKEDLRRLVEEGALH